MRLFYTVIQLKITKDTLVIQGHLYWKVGDPSCRRRLRKEYPQKKTFLFCVHVSLARDDSPSTPGAAAAGAAAGGAAPAPAPAAPAARQAGVSNYYSDYCVVPKTYGDYTSCCGSQAYDYRYNICCNGVLSPNCGSSTSCCDQVPYNYNQYVCCYPSYLILYKQYGDYTGCCGSTALDWRNQSCCYGQVNQLVFNPQTQVKSSTLAYIMKNICPDFFTANHSIEKFKLLDAQ